MKHKVATEPQAQPEPSPSADEPTAVLAEMDRVSDEALASAATTGAEVSSDEDDAVPVRSFRGGQSGGFRTVPQASARGGFRGRGFGDRGGGRGFDSRGTFGRGAAPAGRGFGQGRGSAAGGRGFGDRGGAGFRGRGSGDRGAFGGSSGSFRGGFSRGGGRGGLDSRGGRGRGY